MRIFLVAFTLGLCVATPALAGDEGLVGNWKFSLHEGGPQSLWLIHFEKDKDGKLIASAEQLKGAPKVKIQDLKLLGDTFTLKFHATLLGPGGAKVLVFDYEGKLPKPGAKKIFGSLREGKATIPAVMEATTAKNQFELDRELVLRTPSDPKALEAIFDVIDRAKENKIDAQDLKALVESSLKGADMYGPRLQLSHQLRLLRTLRGQKQYAEIGVETARKIGKQVDSKAPLDQQLEILPQVAGALRAGGQPAEAGNIEARLDTLENQAYSEYAKSALNFKLEKYPGRKAKSNRAVLVELFTGAQCPPCVANDMAFDGVEKTYAAGDVVLLQYHLHIPAPDPLANEDSDDRFKYYLDKYPAKVRGTPSNLFNGKIEFVGGGGREEAPDKYKEFYDTVNKHLELTGDLKVSAKAIRTGEKIAISATVQGIEKANDKVRLRLVLVEDWVRYKGNNRLEYHHRVVRALAGGNKGFAVTDKNFQKDTTIDLDELRDALNKYLDEDYGDGPRPMRFRHLSVVAFVQNDQSAEVLQAVNVAVKEK